LTAVGEVWEFGFKLMIEFVYSEVERNPRPRLGEEGMDGD
jgi:hypothetical protein